MSIENNGSKEENANGRISGDFQAGHDYKIWWCL